MKKLMKAIAFATVMCMLLSTAAFAANSVAEDSSVAKQINVRVESLESNEQVALVIVEKDLGLSSEILYIDQKAATGTVAEFEAPIAAEVEAVDVYVGYASNTGDEPVHVGYVELREDAITEVTVVMSEDVILQEGIQGQEQTGAGVAATFTVKAPEGVTAKNMIWAIRFTDAQGNKVKYSDPIDIARHSFGSVLDGSVRLGFAFLNGSILNEIDSVEITKVDAIFLFTDGVENGFRQEVFTNENDKKD